MSIGRAGAQTLDFLHNTIRRSNQLWASQEARSEQESWRYFKFLTRSTKILKDLLFSHQDLQGSIIFLPRSSTILHFFVKIFKDLLFSCKDLLRIKFFEIRDKIFWRSLKIWTRKCNILKNLGKKMQNSLRILARKCKILEDLGKKMQDPWGSWQENKRCLRILARKWKILEDFGKKMQDLWGYGKKIKDILKDLGKKIKDPWRS